MRVDEILIYLIVLFVILGAIDKAIGGRFGLGEKFDEGIKMVATLSFSMVGIIVLSPVLANILKPIFASVFEWMGADLAMLAGCLFANDLGGAALARELTTNQDIANFSGLIVSTMLGGTIVFTIPVSLSIVKEEDRRFCALGILVGIITVPIGSFVGGVVAGYSIPMLLRNLTPVFLFVAMIALGLWKFEKALMKIFICFGKFMELVILFGLTVGIVEALTGFTILPGANPVSEGFRIVCEIVIFLAGAYPLMLVVTKLCQKPLLALGKRMGINEVSAAGLATNLINSVPMFSTVKDMDKRGKVINMAFSVSASFVFGDHLAFTAGMDSSVVFPLIVGKLVGGITAIVVAILVAKKAVK